MADFFPLVVDTVNERVKELPAGDTLDLTGATIKTDTLKIEQSTLMSTSSTTTDCDLATSSFFTINLTSSRTITFSNPDATSGYVQTFMIEFSTTGAYSVSWPGNLIWDGNIAPSIPQNKRTLISFYTTDNGTTYRGNVVLVTSVS